MSRTLPRPIRGRGRSLASMVGMGLTFEDGRQRGCARRKKDDGGSSLRKRNELMFVGDGSEAAGLPVLLGLLDPLLAGGDEVPPDMARAFQRVAAEKHHPRWLCRLHGDAIAGAKDQQPRTFVAFIGYLDLAVNHIDGALFMVGVERDADAL